MWRLTNVLTHLSSLRVRRQQGFSIWLGLLLFWGHVETQTPDIEVFLHGSPPCLSWSSPLSPALRSVRVMVLESMRQTCPDHCRVSRISARVSIPVLFHSCCCYVISSFTKLRCFTDPVGEVHSDSTVSIVGFEGLSNG